MTKIILRGFCGGGGLLMLIARQPSIPQSLFKIAERDTQLPCSLTKTLELL